MAADKDKGIVTELKWTENNVPVSVEYDDPFFDTSDGLSESRYVFLELNQLNSRWPSAETFTIGEIGFGVGLNFLATWELWEKRRSSDQVLNYVSFESAPVLPKDIKRALSPWPSLSPYLAELLESFPRSRLGVHRVTFEPAGVSLTLIWSDALEGLRSLTEMVNAWYLDGFAPRKNPSAWCLDLCHEIAAHSVLGTTCSTFSSASLVRQNLCEAGFEVEKVSGFGKKRECLRGRYLKNNP